MAREFDFNKEKAFEERTNYLHFNHIERYLSQGFYMTDLIEINDIEMQRDGIDVQVDLDDGREIKIELKTDKHIDSPNLFLEDVSSFESKSVGWTMKCKADILSYGFYNEETESLERLYFFHMPRLRKWFRKHYKKYEPKRIQNNGYHSRGRAVPIEDIKDFLLWDMNQAIENATKKQMLSDFF